MRRHPRARVVVVGAGFAGLNAARALADGPFDVTVVDRDNYHGFWPLLYQVATAGLGADDIAHPIRGMFGARPNVRVRLGTVDAVDLDRREITFGAERVGYDYLVIAAGSSTNDFGMPGIAEHAFPLKTLPDAIELRNHILTVFERADASPELVAAGLLTLVIVGGGPTGVEVAGALSELISRNLATDFTQLDVAAARVVLIEMGEHLLADFSARSRESAQHTLEARGVEVRLHATLARVDAHRVILDDGEEIPCGTVVWTAGVKANPLAELIEAGRGRGGRLQVSADLSLPGHPEVFVVGDIAAATGHDGSLLPQLGQVAIQGGRHAARSIRHHHDGKPTRPFRYHDHGVMATIGRRSAVAELPFGISLRGTAGWVAWLGVHIMFLIGFRNKVVVLASWAWNYLTWERAGRVIVGRRPEL